MQSMFHKEGSEDRTIMGRMWGGVMDEDTEEVVEEGSEKARRW